MSQMEKELNWGSAQDKELNYWIWHYTFHTPFTTRDQVLGYTYFWGRQQARQCGLPVHYEPKAECAQLDDILSGNILDVGCGPVSVMELRPNAHVTAIDPLMDRYIGAMPFLKLPMNGFNNTHYFNGDVFGVDSHVTDTYDIVWCYNVLDHAADWREIVARCGELVKPGGMLCIGVDCREALDDTMAMHPSVIPRNDLIWTVKEAGLWVGWVTPSNKKQKQRVGLWARKDDALLGTPSMQETSSTSDISAN